MRREPTPPRRLVIAAFLAVAVCALSPSVAAGPSPRRVTALADDYVAATLRADPTLAYLFGLQLSAVQHERLPDNSRQGRLRFARTVNRLQRELRAIDRSRLAGEERVLHAILEEELTSEQRLRVCRRELWDVSHYDGWLTSLSRLASSHSVGTPDLRQAALRRWRKLPAFVDREIANLREGLAAGYAVPRRVAEQARSLADGLTPADVTASPFHSLVTRAGDGAFAADMRRLVERDIYPALRRYRDFLVNEYIPAAPTGLSVAALPDGRDCYRALVRRYTTLERTPEQLLEMAEAADAAALATIRRLGERRYGISHPPDIVRRARVEPAERYGSPGEMLDEARRTVAESRGVFAPFFRSLPKQEVVVEPYPPHQQGLGLDARYDHSEEPSVPAVYRIPVERYDRMTRSGNITTTWHEGLPGHHLLFGRRAGTAIHPLRRLVISPAFNEGWAQYAEGLGQQSRMAGSETARIILAAGGSRAMLMDLLVHWRGWDRVRLAAYLIERGGAGAGLDARLDRLAARPGQFLAYFPAQMEFQTLRAEAEGALGVAFDIRDFHEIVLEDGPVPMWYVREKVQNWIASEQPAASASR